MQLTLMPKVPHIGEKKRNSVFVATIDCITVSNAATWLSNYANTAFTCFLHRIIPGCS